MLKTDLATLALINRGVKPVYTVVVYFQQTETYTPDDMLESVGDITNSLSSDGRYENSNTTITLYNRDYYFGQKFRREMPNNKRCEVYKTIGAKTVSVFSGLISNWTLTDSRLTLNVTPASDAIKLRQSSVYGNPRTISTLKIVYGDFSQSRIKAEAIDKDCTIFHVSDRPMQLINSIYENGGLITAGFKRYAAYKDETGRSIACVIFDNPRPNLGISVSGKGTMKSSGELIENPADLLEDLFLNVQGSPPESLDAATLAQFRADCLKEEIKVATVLDSPTQLRTLLDDLASNIHAQWMLSDGRGVMRLRWI